MKIAFSKTFLKIMIFTMVFVVGVLTGTFGVPAVKAKLFPSALDAAVQNQANYGVGPIKDLDEFLVNLEGGGLVKVEISIEGVNSKSEKELNSKEIFIRDRIITVLSSKSMGDIGTPKGQENLKKELLRDLNEVCNNQIKEVLFKNFVYSF
ncbi:MAG: flagellar basal body-associated FliL family protein [Peptococcaceae bacterium]|nr:flagellar basal body-associated FliL family protein [Peptococcaceae bacterium]